MGLLNYFFGVAGLGAGALFYSYLITPLQVHAAVEAAIATQSAQCTDKIKDNAASLNKSADETLDSAMEAAASGNRTPVDQAELQDICKAEPECREALALAKAQK